MEEIKPCAHCGSKAQLTVEPNRVTQQEGVMYASVKCTNCSAESMLSRFTEEEAKTDVIELWNSRWE